jgi:hypothetical protein
MSRTRFNKNGTVNITGISLELYYAIQEIVSASESAFLDPEENGKYYSNCDFLCSLTPKEKEELEKIDWIL